jgi:hypothetical protein
MISLVTQNINVLSFISSTYINYWNSLPFPFSKHQFHLLWNLYCQLSHIHYFFNSHKNYWNSLPFPFSKHQLHFLSNLCSRQARRGHRRRGTPARCHMSMPRPARRGPAGAPGAQALGAGSLPWWARTTTRRAQPSPVPGGVARSCNCVFHVK